jgi:hypothetical protein
LTRALHIATPRTPERSLVEAKGRRSRNRKRSTGATTIRRIDARARERQAAWTETGQPNLTERLTRELDGLYGDYRDERVGAPIGLLPGVTE